MDQTYFVQLNEMSAASNSSYSVGMWWKGCFNGSLVTNLKWESTSIFFYFLSGRPKKYLFDCFSEKFGGSHYNQHYTNLLDRCTVQYCFN